MDDLKRYLAKEFSSQGARIMMPHENSILILDCPKWTAKHTKNVKLNFPDVDMEIESTDLSLSGFTVLFSKNKMYKKKSLIVFFVCVVCSLVYFAVSTQKLFN